MNGDLESTLNELGPEYRDIVARLKSAREVESSGTRAFSFTHTVWWRRAGYLVAASLAIALGLSILRWREGVHRRLRSDRGGA